MRLNQRGFIKKAKYTGWYSTIDECFYSQQDLEDVSINGAKKKVTYFEAIALLVGMEEGDRKNYRQIGKFIIVHLETGSCHTTPS